MATASDDLIRRGPMREGLRIQSRVVGALMMRDLHSRYGRENIGYLWLFLEPMLLATMIGLIHMRSASHFGNDLKPVPVALLGYCNFMTFRSIVNRSEGALEGSLGLFYHRTISIFDLLLSRALLEAAGTAIAFTVLIGVAIAFGIANLPERPLFLIVGMFSMMWLSFGLSMIICGITHDNKAIGRLVHPVTYIMMPLSGAFFTLEMMPSKFRDIISWIPLAQIFEILRYGWFKAARPDYIDWLYLTSWLLGTTLVGLLLISVVRKRIQMT